jgi:integrating conjugative element protein (TIGR03758 family)
MAMDATMANAFAAGSGIDPSDMKVAILTLTGAGLALLLAWIVTRLWHAYQDEHISSGEMVAETVTLVVIVMAVIAFLGWYR